MCTGLCGRAIDPELTWSIGPQNYPSPGALVANCTVRAPVGTELLSLIWRPNLPPDWTVLMAWGDGEPEYRAGTEDLVFTGPALGSNGLVNFYYVIRIPDAESGARTVHPVAEFHLDNEINPRAMPASVAYLGPGLTVTVIRAGSGLVFPPGPVTVSPGADQNFQFLPDAYFHTAAVQIDGTPIGNPSSYLFAAIMSNRTLQVSFAENLCPLGTPEWWLAEHGLMAGGFPAQELEDADGDGSRNWEEYVAGTDPTNRSSVLRIAAIREVSGTNFTLQILASTNGLGDVVVETQRVSHAEGRAIAWFSASNRIYDLECGTNLASSFHPVPGASGLTATSPLNVFTNPAMPAGPMTFYRVRVSRGRP